MPYEVVWESRGVYKRFYGHVGNDELVQSVAKIHGDARFDDLRYIVNDFLAVESYDVTVDTVTYIAAIDNAARRSNENIRIAVVSADPAIQTLVRPYQASPWSTYPIRIFATVEEARAWL